MVDSVALPGGIRTTLRHLTATSAAVAASGLRLSTGVKLASPLDGAGYFAATGLRQRALGLLTAKEEQFRVVSTIKAADKAAESIESLIRQARVLAETARNTPGIADDPERARSLAAQFDTVIAHVNAVARDGSVRDGNLATARDHDRVVRTTDMTGVRGVAVTNASRDARFVTQVVGDGGIGIGEEDRSRLETALGIRRVRATGFSSATAGGFSDLRVTIVGRQGADRIITVSDGRDAVSHTVRYADLAQGDQHVEARLASGARLDFDLNRALLDEAVGTGNAVSLSVRKRVDLTVEVAEANTGQRVARSGLSDEDRLADGENGFRFGDATYRLNLDEAGINRAAGRGGPTLSDAYGAAAAVLVGGPLLAGTPGAGEDQGFRLSFAGTGLDTAEASSSVVQAAAPARAQVNRYSAPALAAGQSARISINGTDYTATAGAGGMTADQVAGTLAAQLGGAGLQLSTAGLPSHMFDLAAAAPGAGYASAVSGGILEQTIQPAAAARAQVNRVAFTPTVELGETYGITIDGRTYAHTSVSGDTLQSVLSALAGQITPSSGTGGDPSVTATLLNGAIELTGKLPGASFTQSAQVDNRSRRLTATLSNGLAADTQNLPLDAGPTAVTFTGAFGNAITGVTLTLDTDRLAGVALKGESLGFDVRFAQAGETGNASVTLVGRAADRGDITVHFDPAADSAYRVQAQNLLNDGLGLDLSANGWRDRADIDRAIADCDRAVERVRASRSSYAVSLGVLTTRGRFAEGTAAILEEGADKLTLLDQQEEGAALLAQQTRLQIATTSLSIASRFYASMLTQMLSGAR